MSIMLSERFRARLIQLAHDRTAQAMEAAMRYERSLRDEFPQPRPRFVDPTRVAVRRVMSEMADDRMNQPVLDEGNGEDRADLDPNFARRLDIE